MRIDLKILLVILAVILVVGFLEADPASRRRSSYGSSRRRSYSSSRRRTSSYSRRRRSSSGSSISSSDSSGDSTVLTVVVVVVVIVIICICFVCFCVIRAYIERRELEQYTQERFNMVHENQNPVFKGLDGDAASKTNEQPANENNPAQNHAAFDNAGVDATPLLPYPSGVSDQNAVYPQSSLPYPPQEGIYPPAPPYPPESSSSAYPPQGRGEEMSVVQPAGRLGETHEGSTTCAPPIQFESGNDLPPPPSYEDIDEKKKL